MMFVLTTMLADASFQQIVFAIGSRPVCDTACYCRGARGGMGQLLSALLSPCPPMYPSYTESASVAPGRLSTVWFEFTGFSAVWIWFAKIFPLEDPAVCTCVEEEATSLVVVCEVNKTLQLSDCEGSYRSEADPRTWAPVSVGGPCCQTSVESTLSGLCARLLLTTRDFRSLRRGLSHDASASNGSLC